MFGKKNSCYPRFGKNQDENYILNVSYHVNYLNYASVNSSNCHQLSFFFYSEFDTCGLYRVRFNDAANYLFQKIKVYALCEVKSNNEREIKLYGR